MIVFWLRHRCSKMEIRIDTKKDSPEEIQHMIDFLTRFISAQEMQVRTSSPDTGMPSPEANQGMFGMFGSDPAPSTPEESSPEKSEFTIQPY